MIMSATMKETDDSYVGHKNCPKCGSKDNVYRYADGHEFCFGRCGYFKPASLTKEAICALVEERTEYKRTTLEKSSDLFPMPEDAYAELKAPGLTWIKKYGIHNEELREHDILWSESQQQLIFPIYNENYFVIAWQARNFIPNSKKYLTYGKMDSILHILGLTTVGNPDIILVEDMVSAIKVSRNYRCMPLFGSGCSRDKLMRLYRFTDHIRFWLDRDKLGTAMALSKTAALLGFKTSVIYTEKDPKEMTNDEIIQLGK